ncbi:MAG TPA: alkylmercury lyase family protein [Alphaproteobacteria bacterium]|nr:alkylmercury lyase family protein [Alphaproteobacteria bacterium]
MPDWSAITRSAAREALTALYEVLDWDNKLAGISPGEDCVWRAAVDQFVESGAGPVLDRIMRATGLSRDEVDAAVARLAQRDVLVVDESGAMIVGAYPFSVRPTGHIVRVNDRALNAMCAVDALGVGAMYGRDVSIDSACRHCEKGVAIATKAAGKAIATVTPRGAVVWSGIRYADNCAASSLCRVLVFFCSDDHLEAWRDARDPGAPGYRLTIEEALEVGKAIFQPIRLPASPTAMQGAVGDG